MCNPGFADCLALSAVAERQDWIALPAPATSGGVAWLKRWRNDVCPRFERDKFNALLKLRDTRFARLVQSIDPKG